MSYQSELSGCPPKNALISSSVMTSKLYHNFISLRLAPGNAWSFILARHAPIESGFSSIFAVGSGLRPLRNHISTKISFCCDCGEPGVFALPVLRSKINHHDFRRIYRTNYIVPHFAFLGKPDGSPMGSPSGCVTESADMQPDAQPTNRRIKRHKSAATSPPPYCSCSSRAALKPFQFHRSPLFTLTTATSTKAITTTPVRAEAPASA